MPQCKDLYYFDRYYERGWDWYASYFSAVDGEHAIGELSHDYMYSTQALERIQHDLPEVKLVACLREPASRSFSQYLYMVHNGLTSLPFAEALQQFPELVEHSLYHKHLAPYFEAFGPEAILLLDFGQISAAPHQICSQLFRFLGVADDVDVAVDQRVRGASRARSRVVARIVKWAASRVRDAGFAHLVGRLRDSGRLSSVLYQSYGDKKPQAPVEAMAALRPVFDEDQARLEHLVGRRFDQQTGALHAQK